ncbi:MAG: hypothetical protein OEY89_02410 [Gammaproteobacteria bacterium]|nr:hypothetical protein [Gammaproteobacteria bacterium]
MNITKVDIGKDGHWHVYYEGDATEYTVPVTANNVHAENVRGWIGLGNIPVPPAEPTAMELWKRKMANSDVVNIPRWIEDHIESDHGGISANANLQARYNQKKLLRASKPQ